MRCDRLNKSTHHAESTGFYSVSTKKGSAVGVNAAIRNLLGVVVGLVIGIGTLYLYRRRYNDLVEHFLLPVNGLYVYVTVVLSFIFCQRYRVLRASRAGPTAGNVSDRVL